MKKHIFRNRKARFASITVLLTLLVITVTVLANAMVGKLANRFNWYTVMVAQPNYEVTESCYDLLENAFDRFSEQGVATNAEIIFCNTKDKLAADESMVFIYESALALEARFPEQISVKFYDVVSNPTLVQNYATAPDPQTGEMVESIIPQTSVIITDGGDYHHIYAREDFYLVRTGETGFWAYDGELRFASGILRALDPQRPVACLMQNHGETFYDYELHIQLENAGYSVKPLNLYTDEIPEDCTLLVSYNPTADLTSDELSATSEPDLLDAYLSESGNNLMVLVGNSSPALPNFEKFLAKWGVGFDYHTVSGKNYRYMVNDESNSLTSDGYTIYGEQADFEMLSGLSKPAIFRNATAMDNASDFVSNGNGGYAKGNRTMYPLYTGGATAESWADGSYLGGADDAILMSLTQQANADGGVSSVAVVAATDFASEDLLQSVVYGNNDVLFRMLKIFGKNHTPEGLTAKPFQTEGISMITTREMTAWTVALAVTPALVLTAIALVVLIRRRRA